jgi:hypothetical protein
MGVFLLFNATRNTRFIFNHEERLQPVGTSLDRYIVNTAALNTNWFRAFQI